MYTPSDAESGGSYRWRLALLMGFLALALAIFWLWPKVAQRLAPAPIQAWVGIEVGDSGIARVGKVEIGSGERFTLHAVLEARGQDGERIFYTDAQALSIAGEEFPAASLRSWQGKPVRILWFTVEGHTPVLFLDEGESVSQFHYGEFLRSEWGTGWSTSGSLSPAHDAHLTESSLMHPEPFGTQRFHVRIELFETAASLVPVERYSSWGAEEIFEHLEGFPTVVARESGDLGQASSFFGLSEIVPGEHGGEEASRILAVWTEKGIAYSGLTLLRDLVKSAGQPEWRLIDLTDALAWGGQVRAGDLLRVGSRFAVLYADELENGILDQEDLVLDFHLGPKVVRLGDIFEGGGALEWAAPTRDEGVQ